MILRQFLRHDPVALSSMVGCVGHEAEAVIVALFPIGPYLRTAEAGGTPIRFVIDIHLQADHVSAGRALAEPTGAVHVLHECAGAAFGFRVARDGETLGLGEVTLSILRTPGHTLMVGDVGRTELAGDTASGAPTLVASLARLKAPPDHLEVSSGAFAGSVCGRGLSGKPVSAVGFERSFNEAFALTEENGFVDFMLANIPPPREAAAIRARNAGLLPAKVA